MRRAFTLMRPVFRWNRRVREGVMALALALAPATLLAQQPPGPPPQQPPAGPPAPQTPQTTTTPTTPAASSIRTFTAPVGMIINAVRSERVADFEKLIGYLKVALASTSDTTIRAQAEGWKVLKATETGPNGAVLFVFLFEPTVPGADYGLGRILAAAFPDQAKLQEVWKLYTDSLATGGSLLNLTPNEGTTEALEPAK